MGSMMGHVLPGFGFFIIGLWHIINHTKRYTLHPKLYTSLTWFPTSKIRYLELYAMMGGATTSIFMELFFGPKRHHPLDLDATIPSTHLHNIEHSNISLSIFVYAVFAIVLDKIRPPAHYSLTLFVGSIAFGIELLLFHLHSVDHTGVEGQYHWLLQITIFSCLVTTLMSIGHPKSFLVSFVRSVSIFFQGVWMIFLGIMLWTPGFIPKGCFMNLEEAHYVVRCHSNEAQERAKSLANIEFSWLVVGVTIFTVSVYLYLNKIYGQKVEYQCLPMYHQDEEEEDVESQKKSKLEEPKSFINMGKVFPPMDMEIKR